MPPTAGEKDETAHGKPWSKLSKPERSNRLVSPTMGFIISMNSRRISSNSRPSMGKERAERSASANGNYILGFHVRISWIGVRNEGW